jgi:probable F420-dependent oxidoreductase
MSLRRFRFGVVAAMARSGEEWLARARRVEALGDATLLVPDRLGALLAPIPALAAAAAVTTTLRLGTFVLASGWRNPVVLAHEAKALALLSSGRFELGLGAGVGEEEYRQAGVPFGTPGERIERLAETLRVVKAELGERRPRLLVAAGGPRARALAAREADVVALGSGRDLTEATLVAAAEQIRAAAGARTPELSINLVAVLAPGHAVAPWVRERVRGFFGAEVEALAEAGSPFVPRGDPDEMAARLVALRERTGVSYISLPDDQIEAFAPVVERLTGR